MCLEYKKVLSSYENMQLEKALEELEGSGSEVKGLVQGLLATDWSGLQAKLASPEVADEAPQNEPDLAFGSCGNRWRP